jgi:hypothetical protein
MGNVRIPSHDCDMQQTVRHVVDICPQTHFWWNSKEIARSELDRGSRI